MPILIDDIREGWAWTGVEPREVVDINPFGNVIFVDVHQQYWRIIPEELALKSLALNNQAFQTIQNDVEFQTDWKMDNLVALANDKLGKLDSNRCYCLKIPAVLGGAYERENIASIDLAELVRSSGNMAHQIKDLPDGAKIELKISD